ncbi:MAG: trypsin-like peptidase domain-containing protein [Planctomycetota bacterium]
MNLPTTVRTTLLGLGLWVNVAVPLVLVDSTPGQERLEATGLLGAAPLAEEDLDLRTTPVVRAVQRAADSVVSIYVLDARGGRREQAVEGQGSGVIVDESGLVITNWHVVTPVLLQPGLHRVEVRLRDDRRFAASVLSSSPEHDLALLQLELRGERVKPVTPGRSAGLMIGETVIAIGNPEGQANTVTQGVLSAMERSITVRAPDGQTRRYQGLLQTDAAINRGNSGGALLDITGKLIGINNAMAVGVENIGFAIPVDTVRRVFQDILLSADNLATVWLGARIEDVDGLPTVTAITAGSPAQRAGFRSGDRLLTVRGEAVKTALDSTRMLALAKPGDRVPFRLRRDREQVELLARVVSNLERDLAFRTGILVETLTAREHEEVLRRATQVFYAGTGRQRVQALRSVLRVTDVAEESPAADIGIEPGDILVGVQVRDFFGARLYPVASPDAFADIARQFSGGRIPILVMRDGESLQGELEVRRQ